MQLLLKLSISSLSLTISLIKYISPPIICYYNQFPMSVTPARTRVPWLLFNPRGYSLLYILFYPQVSTGTQEFKTSKDWMKISSVNSQTRIHNQWKCPSAMNMELMTSQRKENWEDLLLADLPKQWKPLRWNFGTAERKVKMTLRVLNGVGRLNALMKMWSRCV